MELTALPETVGITFVYVTHDQEEALTMSDRLAVMEKGKIAQVGTPVDVYEEPVDADVADFLGVSNLVDANASGVAGEGMTPHVSGTTLSAQARYAAGTREILECFLGGRPIREEYLIVDGVHLAGAGAHSCSAKSPSAPA